MSETDIVLIVINTVTLAVAFVHSHRAARWRFRYEHECYWRRLYQHEAENNLRLFSRHIGISVPNDEPELDDETRRGKRPS